MLRWWLWLPALGVAALLAAEVHMGAGGLRSWVPYVVLLPLAAAALWWLGRIRVAVVQDGPQGPEFQVDDARLPARYISTAVALDANGKREILGRLAHPMAFVVQRPWVSGAVQVMLDDPADPTPYWVVSSHRPQRLAATLLAARDAAAEAAIGEAAGPTSRP